MAGVGGGIRRVELRGGEHTFVKPALNFIRIQRVRQVAGHQWGKIVSGRNGVKDTLAIGNRGLDGSDWRNQVRHNNRTAINFAGIRHDGFQHVAITKMDMPVVWAADFENLGLYSHGSSGLKEISHKRAVFAGHKS
ncbi:Uncharacterised protein [Enterobacter cloacae]|nr:Uncharacterised protein [Enterobacter cloacae]